MTVDIAAIAFILSAANTWALTRRHRDLALVSAVITVALLIIVVRTWQ